MTAVALVGLAMTLRDGWLMAAGFAVAIGAAGLTVAVATGAIGFLPW